jgi:hypothetical protein
MLFDLSGDKKSIGCDTKPMHGGCKESMRFDKEPNGLIESGYKELNGLIEGDYKELNGLIEGGYKEHI